MAVLLIVAVASVGLELKSVFRLENMIQGLAEKEFEGNQAALKLEIALLEQRGLVMSAIARGSGSGALQELEWRRRNWAPALNRTRAALSAPSEHLLLTRLEETYARYDAARETAIGFIRAGDLKAASSIYETRVSPIGDEAHGLCEQVVLLQQQRLAARLAEAKVHVQQTTLGVMVGLFLAAAVAVLLVLLMLRDVFRPLRRIANRAQQEGMEAEGDADGDELNTVARRVEQLILEATSSRASLVASEGRRREAESMGKLAACVAHEVRGPLQTMRIALHSFDRQVQGDPVLTERCEFLRDEIARLDRIVRSFLEFSRPPRIELQGVQIGAVLDRTLMSLRHRLEATNVEVRRNLSDGAPWISGDPEQLQQVFTNLISNSIEAMPHGGAIEITTRTEHCADRNWVVLTIRDEGCGIPPQIREQLFEPFTTSRAGGTGLGLSISASIVSRHGGVLDLEASDEHGTAFVMRLPALAEA